MKYIIDELVKELNTGDYGDCLVDYTSGYICDNITEIADSHVDIYNADLFEWAKRNYEYVEEAVSEGLVDTSNFDVPRALQAGQYLQIEQDIYEHLDDVIMLYILNYIKDVWNLEELTEEQKEAIDGLSFDSNDELDDINEALREIFEKDDEE